MGNTESEISDEENVKMEENKDEVIRVFQPQKLRQELENGKKTLKILFYRLVSNEIVIVLNLQKMILK